MLQTMLLQAICGQIISSGLNQTKPWMRFNSAEEDFDHFECDLFNVVLVKDYWTLPNK